MNIKDKSKAEAQKVFAKAVDDLNEKLEKEKLDALEKATKGSSGAEKSSASKPWSSDDLALIIKAVNLFPAGTTNRYLTQLELGTIFSKVA